MSLNLFSFFLFPPMNGEPDFVVGGVDQFLLFWPLCWKRLCVDCCCRGNKGSFGSNAVRVSACDGVWGRGCERKKEWEKESWWRVWARQCVCDTANVRSRGEGGCRMHVRARDDVRKSGWSAWKSVCSGSSSFHLRIFDEIGFERGRFWARSKLYLWNLMTHDNGRLRDKWPLRHEPNKLAHFSNYRTSKTA